MNLLNVILFTTMPPTLQAINLPATAMLGIIMSCRLILNIRNPVQKAVGHRAVKTTQYNTGAPAGFSDASTTVASYQMHEFSSQDLEAGAKQSVDKVTMGSYEPK